MHRIVARKAAKSAKKSQISLADFATLCENSAVLYKSSIRKKEIVSYAYVYRISFYTR